ncbi:MAG TPA: hypothetical protein VN029_14360 [Sphingomonas sp.]|nr:hypothetical protein [Sphingomonas sp.]
MRKRSNARSAESKQEMTSRIQSLLQDIGRLMANAIVGDPSGAFLYAEVEPGMTSWGLFVDRGDYVEYLSDDEGICEALVDLWRLSEQGKKWSGLSYAIVQGSFDAQFYYSESWVDDEIYADRRERILAARYADKPIRYPPPPSDAMEV